MRSEKTGARNWSGPCFNAVRKLAGEVVTAIAANSVTSLHSAAAPAAGSAKASGSDDLFSTILDDLMQAEAVSDPTQPATSDTSTQSIPATAANDASAPADPSILTDGAPSATADASTNPAKPQSADASDIQPKPISPAKGDDSKGAAPSATDKPVADSVSPPLDASLVIPIAVPTAATSDNSSAPQTILADAADPHPADPSPGPAPSPAMASDAANDASGAPSNIDSTPVADLATGAANTPANAVPPNRQTVGDKAMSPITGKSAKNTGRTSDSAPSTDGASTPSDPLPNPAPAQSQAVQQPAPSPDPALAQSLAIQPPVPAVATANDNAANDADPVQAAPAASNLAAAAMLSDGATLKPASAGASNPKPADSTKTQGQTSTAAAVASDAATRSFTDRQVAGTQALPVPSNDHKSVEQNASAPTGQPAATPANAGTDASAAPPQSVKPAAAPQHADAATNPVPQAPVHAQTAPQPVAMASAGATASPVPPSAPASVPVQAQINVSQQPDINQLAVNIAAKFEGGSHHFDIRLDPADLGRVDVRLTVDDTGKAQASLSVEKPQTLELLQKDQTQLERALKDSGLDLSQNGLSFSLKGQQQQNQSGGNASASRGRALAARAIAAVDSAASTVSLGSVSASDTRLDIRV